MPDLSYDLQELSDGSRAVTEVAGTASTNAQGLAEAVNAAAMCWGTDAPGQAFAERYLEPATEAMTSALQVGGQLSAIAGNIAKMRTVYEQGEDEATTEIQGLGL